MMKFFLPVLLPFLLALFSTHGVAADASPARARSASVGVLVDGRLEGSGWFAAGHGLAVTAAHVLAGSRRVEVLVPARGRRQAQVIARDLRHDLALLQVEPREGFFASMEVADTAPGPNVEIFLTGSPLFRHNLTVPGRVAAEALRYEWNERNQCYTRTLPVAAVVAEGFSGGAWTDADGDVVGVQSGVMSRQGAPMGLAFMIPAAAVTNLLQSKKDQPAATVGAVLAEAWEPPLPGDETSRNGLTVIRLTSASPLAGAGVTAGERILALNGREISYRDDFLRGVEAAGVGARVRLRVEDRAGKTRTVEIAVGTCKPPMTISPDRTP